MEKEFSKLVTESEDTFRSALAIKRTLDALDDERWELFKGTIFDNVRAVLPTAEVYEEGNAWHAIKVPVKNGKYLLYINYNWHLISFDRAGDDTEDSAEEKRLAKKMSEIMGVEIHKNQADETIFWYNGSANIYYPGLEDTDEDLYLYQLYKQYSEHHEEVALRIVSIAQSLENA
jgi:hypothetical protein